MRLRIASLIVIALAGAQHDALAATGGPDALGVTWADQDSGCTTDFPVFGPDMRRWDAPVGWLGPEPLGFNMPFAGGIVGMAWISPTGFVAFEDQGADGASPVTQRLPDPRPPNYLVAPCWKPAPADRVEVEQQGDRFVLAWYRDEGAPFPSPAFLTLFSDGRMEMHWSGTRFSGGDATVGYENFSGSAGTTWWRDGAAIEPGAPPPQSGRSLCLTPPVLLDCSAPVPLACGESADITLRNLGRPQAVIYACSSQSYSGQERVVSIDVARPQVLTVTADSLMAGLLLVPPPPLCGEAHCLRSGTQRLGEQRLAMPVAFIGTHHVVVDAITASRLDLRVSAACAPLTEIDCAAGLVMGTTADELAIETTYPCVPVPLDGPEDHVLIQHAGGHLVVTDPAGPDRWVILRDAFGTCLASGSEGAALWDAPAGDYVATFDNANGALLPYSATIACGPQLDCAAARPAICGTPLIGDTSAAPRGRVSLYACSPEVLDGREDAWLLDNPREQVVSLRVASGDPSLRVMLLSACDEGRCVVGPAQGGCALVPAGSWLVVVDQSAGREGPYEIEISCARDAPRGPDLRAVSLSTAGLVTTCTNLDVSGTAAFTVVNDGDTVSPGFDVMTFIDANRTNDYEPGADTETGRLTIFISLQAGEQRTFNVPVTATLPFRDAIVHAKVVAPAPPDIDRSNDVTDSGKSCRGTPPPRAPLAAVLEWAWRGSAIAPTFFEVESLPLVGDLDGDGRAEVLACTQETSTTPVNNGCMLRALRGADGSELWTADAPGSRFAIATQQAIGDLDSDGVPEMAGQSLGDPSRLICLNADGSLRWTSVPLPVRSAFDTYSGAPAIADLDGDGRAEVVWGPNAVSDGGALFWTPDPGGTLGANSGGPISTVADLDDDGDQEVIAGPTAYTLDAPAAAGRIMWTAPGLPDGFTAIGDVLPGEPGLEVVLTSPSRVIVLDGALGGVLADQPIPVGGGGPCGGVAGTIGGPATIADVDGDSRADILVVGGDWLACFEGNLALKWRSPVAECSSGVTSATVFDLDGDGRMEVIHADEQFVRILRGEDGVEVWSAPHTSGTAREMPVVADVDADGQAEILIVENRLLGGSGIGNFGVRCYGSASTPWAGARAVWNQHAYHATNIGTDLSVPAPTGVACRVPSPRAEGTFRVQRPLPHGPPLAPDVTLTLRDARAASGTGCRVRVELDLRAGNGGGITAPAPVTIAVFDGDPAAGGTWLASTDAPGLALGEWADVSLAVDADPTDVLFIVADADPTGASLLSECREDNNACAVDVATLGGTVPPLPAAVGPALRASGHGDPLAADITATFLWPLDAGAPRDLGTGPAQQHYHWLRGELDFGNPPILSLLASVEPVLAMSLLDTTPRTPDGATPHCWLYLVRAADACERENGAGIR